MARPRATISLLAALAGCLFSGNAEARNRIAPESDTSSGIVEAFPVLAPFQHVRFCIRYPGDCKSNPNEADRLELNDETSALLKRINGRVNAAIAPALKSYGSNLADRWTIAPTSGDCNDYAVTKRHELVASGLPGRALRLSVVKTASGAGHLVLVAATTNGDLVLDNLTDAIRPWQRTGYEWLKIQSSRDAKFWSGLKASRAAPAVSQDQRKLRFADR
ncbi:transglutaminase-like cysteine peptidase [Bradyrhizobium sp.]|uniref:transglutaminase-like cysteine peptidase n=1 Tax=Bradyrhizobium sp. TaxID=376 RepID=UPI001E01C64F|nr:transglutaminase-like cysteine peptidase [Bradyrhizobium sp.]MBV8701547.1 transglutaminase-like cysteine peptidase [Bradyrhizobium sp.]MBV8920754.1 transglutaminase-like cysteine peptidase [Bradyrhizobium sp.]